MARPNVRVVLDTNILISAVVFGGKPREILLLVLNDEVEAVISSPLFAELFDVLRKRFPMPNGDIQLLEKQIKEKFLSVEPSQKIDVLRDDADNRVLEAASVAGCDFIITGDKELLKLKKFRGIKIVNASQFLSKK